LNKYKNEILKLRNEGASLADIQFFLREKRIVIVLSTIHRWLKKNE